MLPILGGLAAFLIVLIGLAIGRSMLSSSSAPPPPAASAQISVTSQPAGAKVYLGDRYVGIAPMVLPGLLPRTYEVRMELPGYRSQHQVVNVEKGEKAVVEMTLKPAPGSLRLSANVIDTAVEVDGEVQPVTGPLGTSVEVAAGKHTVRFHHDGYGGVTKQVAVKGGETARLAVSLKPLAASTPVPAATPQATHTIIVSPAATPTPGVLPAAAGIRPGQGIGAVNVGMSLDSLAGLLGEAPEPLLGPHVLVFRQHHLYIATNVRNVVGRIGLLGGDERTDRGIGLGSAQAEVLQQYGEPEEAVPHPRSTDVLYRSLGMGFRYGANGRVLVVVVLPANTRMEFKGWGGNEATGERRRLARGRR